MVKKVIIAAAAVAVVIGAGSLSVQHYRHTQAVRQAEVRAQAAKATAAAQADLAKRQAFVKELERVESGCVQGYKAWQALSPALRVRIGEPNCGLTQPVENLLK